MYPLIHTLVYKNTQKHTHQDAQIYMKKYMFIQIYTHRAPEQVADVTSSIFPTTPTRFEEHYNTDYNPHYLDTSSSYEGKIITNQSTVSGSHDPH